MTEHYTIDQIAEACGGRPTGFSAGPTQFRRVAALHDAGPDAVSWIADAAHRRALAATQAGAVIGTADLLAGDRRGILVEDPAWAIARVLELFYEPIVPPEAGIHRLAVVDPTVRLGLGVRIGAGAVVGPSAEIDSDTVIHEGVSVGAGVKIGRDCILHDRCVIYDRCTLGDRVTVHAGAVIGKDGFGFIYREGSHRRIPQTGTVVIEDDVEIGANTCIDRAKFGATRIGRGAKIDNLVQIAHNIQVGPACIITAQCGLSGSSVLEAGVVMGGRGGTVDNVRIGQGAQLGATSVAHNDVPPGARYLGDPAQPYMKEQRDRAGVRRLSRLFEQVAELNKRIIALETAAHHRADR